MELERVQRGASEMVRETEQGLKRLKLFSIERRRLKKDMVKVYRVKDVVSGVNVYCYS